MTLKITAFAVMISCGCMLTSCFSGDEVIYYDDTAVTAVTLGTVTCKRDTTSYTYSAASFPIHIDLVKGEIYNTKLLNAGTVMSKIPVSITTVNSGTVHFKDIAGETYTAFISGDSIDFTTPRTLRVVSNDGNHFRDYTMTIKARDAFADTFTWTELTGGNFVGDYNSMKAVYANDKLYVLGYKGGTNYELLSSANGTDWTSITVPTISVGDTIALAAANNNAYISTQDKLYSAADNFTSAEDIAGMKVILGGCNNDLYALNKLDSIMIGTKDKQTGIYSWKLDKMQNTQAYHAVGDSLPSKDCNFVTMPLKTDKNSCMATIIANKKVCWHDKLKCTGNTCTADTTSIVWSKVVGENIEQPWMYTAKQWTNTKFTMPGMPHISAVVYENYIFAIGGKQPDNVYYSSDSGITWQKNGSMKLPEGFTSTNGAAMVVDNENNIYLIASGSGKIWKGKQNK